MSEKKVHKIFIDYLFEVFDNSSGDLFEEEQENLSTTDLKVLFNTDMSGIRLPERLAMEASKLRSHNGFPDVTLYLRKRDYVGFMVELKDEGVKVRKKDGQLVSNKHVQEQAKVHQMLREQGWFVDFACGIEEAVEFLYKYLSLPDYVSEK